ncbi:hypothetical protein BDZ94DRAFT_1277745 [Collybia nuda]|uniref:Homeobox domain-containing protein n=1 Tax=Collybia nuda TaxID=64659 RepID=A0A9P6CC33_9AGAR|nr:hypothetical protein BDZ94DRAFT_1277745 [Collybia nuda]
MNYSDCSSTAYITSLQQLSSVAQRLKPTVLSAFRRVGQQPPPTTPPSIDKARLNVPPLSLPIPEEIASYLTGAGCSSTVADALSDAFIRSAHQIRTAYGMSYREIADQLASDSNRFSFRLERLQSSLRVQYEEKIISAKQVVLNRAAKLGRQQQGVKTKPKFNQEFVPLLEAYFQYDAYPSAPDRSILATKSMMTSRQIEVWFQNHRNRSNKEGKILRRLSSDPLPFKISLHALEKNMSSFIIPEAERRSPIRPRNPTFRDELDKEIPLHPSKRVVQDNCALFQLDTPSHAYPTIYPPNCDYDPFPTKHQFPAPEWIRTLALSPPRHISHNFDEFITEFTHKLSFRDTNCHQSSDFPVSSRCSWNAATHTTTLPAPLPALIRLPVSTHALTPLQPPYPTSRPPHSYTPRVSASFSRLTTLISTETVQKRALRRAVSISRPTSKYSTLTYRSVSPAMSDTSSSSSLSSPSCTSSEVHLRPIY